MTSPETRLCRCGCGRALIPRQKAFATEACRIAALGAIARDGLPLPCCRWCRVAMQKAPKTRWADHMKRKACDNPECRAKERSASAKCPRRRVAKRQPWEGLGLAPKAMRLLAAGEPEDAIRRLAGVSAEEIARARAALWRRAA